MLEFDLRRPKLFYCNSSDLMQEPERVQASGDSNACIRSGAIITIKIKLFTQLPSPTDMPWILMLLLCVVLLGLTLGVEHFVLLNNSLCAATVRGKHWNDEGNSTFFNPAWPSHWVKEHTGKEATQGHRKGNIRTIIRTIWPAYFIVSHDNEHFWNMNRISGYLSP